MTTLRVVAIGLTAMSLSACTKPHATYTASGYTLVHDRDDLNRAITGAFSNAEQAAELGPDGRPVWMNVELHIVRINPPIRMSHTHPRWYYVEQAEAATPDQPYRQHVYCEIDWGDGTRHATVYAFRHPESYVGWWRTPERFETMDWADMDEQSGCEIVLRAIGPGGFTGGTAGARCPNTSNGATYATSEISILAGYGCIPARDGGSSGDGVVLTAWDRGYDASGKQVWGSTAGPYVFVKQE